MTRSWSLRRAGSLIGLAGCLILAASVVGAQPPAKPASTDGPVIKGFGAVYAVPDADFLPSKTQVFKVVFNVAKSPKAASRVNPDIDTVARYLNLQARAGVPLTHMKLALVLHGAAGKDALNDAVYHSRYGTTNPNLPLIEALVHAGVDVYLCGQTAAAHDFPKTALAPSVKLALSAMTVLTSLQGQGYVLMP